MSKLTDTLKAALAKKQGKHHLENEDGITTDAKPKAKPAPVVGNKPQKKVTGRGR